MGKNIFWRNIYVRSVFLVCARLSAGMHAHSLEGTLIHAIHVTSTLFITKIYITQIFIDRINELLRSQEFCVLSLPWKWST